MLTVVYLALERVLTHVLETEQTHGICPDDISGICVTKSEYAKLLQLVEANQL